MQRLPGLPVIARRLSLPSCALLAVAIAGGCRRHDLRRANQAEIARMRSENTMQRALLEDVRTRLRVLGEDAAVLASERARLAEELTRVVSSDADQTRLIITLREQLAGLEERLRKTREEAERLQRKEVVLESTAAAVVADLDATVEEATTAEVASRDGDDASDAATATVAPPPSTTAPLANEAQRAALSDVSSAAPPAPPVESLAIATPRPAVADEPRASLFRLGLFFAALAAAAIAITRGVACILDRRARRRAVRLETTAGEKGDSAEERPSEGPSTKRDAEDETSDAAGFDDLGDAIDRAFDGSSEAPEATPSSTDDASPGIQPDDVSDSSATDTPSAKARTGEPAAGSERAKPTAEGGPRVGRRSVPRVNARPSDAATIAEAFGSTQVIPGLVEDETGRVRVELPSHDRTTDGPAPAPSSTPPHEYESTQVLPGLGLDAAGSTQILGDTSDDEAGSTQVIGAKGRLTKSPRSSLKKEREEDIGAETILDATQVLGRADTDGRTPASGARARGRRVRSEDALLAELEELMDQSVEDGAR